MGQWLGAGWWFSPGTPVFSTNKSGHHDTAEILLKVALNSMTLETNTTISILCIYPKEVWHAHKFPFQIRIFSLSNICILPQNLLALDIYFERIYLCRGFLKQCEYWGYIFLITFNFKLLVQMKFDDFEI